MEATEALLTATPTVDQRPDEAEDGWYYATPYIPTPRTVTPGAPSPCLSVALPPAFARADQVSRPRASRIHRWAVWQYGHAGGGSPALIDRRLGSARGVVVSRGR